jgi:hypothetical protein
MGSLIDLRKHNIKTEDDALEFLELFVSKAPQIAQVLKGQRLKRASLQARLDNAVTQVSNQSNVEFNNPDEGVLGRLTGRGQKPVATPAQSRLDQLKAAKTAAPAVKKPVKRAVVEDALPPAPAAPGEIGQLNVPTVGGKVPDVTAAPGLPNGNSPLTDEEQRAATEVAANAGPTMPDVTEEDAVQAGGSKSEHPTDDGVQQENSQDLGDELTEDERKALGITTPSVADVTSVGTKAARAQKNAKK